MSSDKNSNFNAEANVNGLIDKLLEVSPKYQAIKIYNEEIKKDSKLSPMEKVAFALERRKIFRQAENLASTLSIADLLLKSNDKSLEKEIPNLDEDWLNTYTDAAKNFSSNDMQTIWAKILAGECENKGSISKKTISIMQTIDSKMAEKFSFLCSHSLIFTTDEEKDLNPIFPRLIEDEYKNNQFIHTLVSSRIINNIDIRCLQAIGLILLDSNPSSFFAFICNKCHVSYYGTEFNIISEKGHVPTGKIAYTKYGLELAWLLHDSLKEQKDDKYIEFVKNYMHELDSSIEFYD